MLWMLAFAVLLLFALGAFWKALKRYRRRQYFRALLSGIHLCFFLVLILALVNLVLGFYSYHRFGQAQQVATVSVLAKGPSSELIWKPQDQASRTVALTGQEWILGAKVLVWQPWVTFLGFDPVYDWEFLGARTSLQGMQLIPLDSAPAWWSRLGRFLLLRFAILSIEGSAVYMPLNVSSTYCVDLGARGLSARLCS